LARTIGRSADVKLLVCSADKADAAGRFGELLDMCIGAAGSTPDLVLWDFPVGFSVADMELLGCLGEEVERRKSLLLSSLSAEEPLNHDLRTCDTLIPVFKEQRFLPLKRLRASQPARCIVLAAPAVRIAPAAATAPTVSLQTGAAWFLLQQWVEQAISGVSPFELQLRAADDLRESIYGPRPSFSIDLREAAVDEAAAAGVTFLRAEAAGCKRVVTLLDTDETTAAYSVFGMNLLVNRVMKLAGIALKETPPDGSVAGRLQRLLIEQLQPLGIITSPDSCVVASSGETVTVSINSDVILNGYPVRFQFDIA
jgi:hypothetical protein